MSYKAFVVSCHFSFLFVVVFFWYIASSSIYSNFKLYKDLKRKQVFSFRVVISLGNKGYFNSIFLSSSQQRHCSKLQSSCRVKYSPNHPPGTMQKLNILQLFSLHFLHLTSTLLHFNIVLIAIKGNRFILMLLSCWI